MAYCIAAQASAASLELGKLRLPARYAKVGLEDCPTCLPFVLTLAFALAFCLIERVRGCVGQLNRFCVFFSKGIFFKFRGDGGVSIKLRRCVVSSSPLIQASPSSANL